MDLYGKTLRGLAEVAVAMNLKPYAARQMAEWLYAKGAEKFDGMTNLSTAVRARLADLYTVGRTEPLHEVVSTDGTRKYLFPADADHATEVAWIPDRQRATVCLSTQIGCRRGCRFCATGHAGFKGQLTAGQILSPYAWLRAHAHVTNLVFMGMGEPLDNVDATMDSLSILTENWGYGLSPTRITVSTVGILPALERLLREARCHIALSLHSPFDEERRVLMPIQAAHPLQEILQVLRKARLRAQRRLMIEYIPFRGLNTSPSHAKALAQCLDRLRCRINLIPFNNLPGIDLEGAGRKEIESFQRLLLDRGLRTTIRASRGADIAAACGLLAGTTASPCAEKMPASQAI